VGRILDDGLPEDLPDDYYDWVNDLTARDAAEQMEELSRVYVPSQAERDFEAAYAAMDDEPARYNRLRDKLLPLEKLRLIPPPVPLNDVLYYDSLAWLAGPPGSYKSFLAVQWACEESRRSKVLYVAAEGVAGLARRVDAWEAATRGRVGRLVFLPEAVDVSGSAWLDLEEIVRESRPKLIVLDTQARMTPGLEENSAADVGRYIAGCDVLRRASGACVLSLHHSSKGQAYLRGSSALMGAADTVVAISRPDELQAVVGVRNVKQKDDRQRPEYWLRPADQANGSMVLVECERPDWWPK
jgi:hypothetical protein